MGEISTMGHTRNDDNISAACYILNIVFGRATEEETEDTLRP